VQILTSKAAGFGNQGFDIDLQLTIEQATS
jgi:hypothetical protein